MIAPMRYKGLYGGRGGTKSHFFAEQAVLRCIASKTRVVCIREVQNSIKDSVRQLIADKIQKLGVGHLFTLLDNEIRGPNNSLIIFKGMQAYNAENIKSLEDYDIAWVEEAQTLSEKSLKLLRPTIRADKSELWFSWNPRFRTDPVDVFFRKRRPSNALSIMVSWKDNPWFPNELRADMEDDFRDDPEVAEHVWNGAYGVDEGSIIARLVDSAERDGRLNACEYDPDGPPIEISSDIGFRDTAAWWFWQRKNAGYSLIGFDCDSGLDAEEWIDRLQERLDDKGWPLGKIWLPHDAKAKTFQTKFTVIEQFLEAFGKGKCKIVPRTSKADRINAARRVIRICEFNLVECEEGVDGLRAWVYEKNPETLVFSKEPLHNWASHPSDGFSYGCQVMEFAPAPEDDEKPPRWKHEQTADEVFWPKDKEPMSQEYV